MVRLIVTKSYSAGEYGPFAHYSINRPGESLLTGELEGVIKDVPALAQMVSDAGYRQIDIDENELAKLSRNIRPTLTGEMNSSYIEHHVGKLLWETQRNNDAINSFLERVK